MSSEFDVNSLLDADFTKQLVEKVSQENSSKNELSTAENDEKLIKSDSEHLQDNLIKNTITNIKKLDNILEDAFEDVASAPLDTDSIDALTKLINAKHKLMTLVQNKCTNDDKFKQNLILTKMRLDAQYKMNQENNETKITLTREAVLKRLLEQSDSNKSIDAEIKN